MFAFNLDCSRQVDAPRLRAVLAHRHVEQTLELELLRLLVVGVEGLLVEVEDDFLKEDDLLLDGDSETLGFEFPGHLSEVLL